MSTWRRVTLRLRERFEEDAAGVLMAGVFICLGLQVITRYVVTVQLTWTEEVARYLFVWLVFFGASAAIRNRSHVAVEFFLPLYPPAVRKIVSLASSLLILLFLGVVMYWGWKEVLESWGLSIAALDFPSGAVYAVIPVSGFFMVLRTIEQMRSKN